MTADAGCPPSSTGSGRSEHRWSTVVAVDTGSKDDSADLLDARLRRRAPGARLDVASRPRSSSASSGCASAARHPSGSGSCTTTPTPTPARWPRCSPRPTADPDADVLGPKLREWPSLRRLLELGVTISGTGRRETGLERGEYDQGQHDEVREVLAVNTAGMLVRRTVLEELGGFDPAAADLRQRHRLRLARRRAPATARWSSRDAVVFHAEAAHRGVRRTPLTGRHTHYQERRAALYTLLANAPGRQLPWLVVRLAFGTLLRMLGFLLVRSVGEALDELAALLSLYAHPGQVRAARRARREQPRGRPRPTPGRCSRRGGCPTGTASTSSATWSRPPPTRPRTSPSAGAPRPPSARPPSYAPRPTLGRRRRCSAPTPGCVARFLTNPVALLLTARRGARAGRRPRRRSARIAGGGLSPAPAGAGDWWRLQVETWHPLGTGTAVPAPAYVLPMALLATAARRQPVGRGLGASSLLAVPFALWGAWRFLRVVGRLVVFTGALALGAAVGRDDVSLVPVVCGAWGDGRLGLVVVAALLPWLAHAALGFADPAPTGAGAPPGGSACCWPWPRRSRRCCGCSPPCSASSWSRPPRWSCAARSGTARSGVRPRPRSAWCRCCSRRGGSRRSSARPAEGLLLDTGRLPDADASTRSTC